jgi:hypothetical protein
MNSPKRLYHVLEVSGHRKNKPFLLLPKIMVLLILLNNKIYLIYLLIDQYLGGMMLFLRGSADVKERYHLLYV